MPASSIPPPDLSPIAPCPPELFEEASRTLAQDVRDLAVGADRCRRRALELGREVSAKRLETLRLAILEAARLLREDPR